MVHNFCTPLTKIFSFWYLLCQYRKENLDSQIKFLCSVQEVWWKKINIKIFFFQNNCIWTKFLSFTKEWLSQDVRILEMKFSTKWL